MKKIIQKKQQGNQLSKIFNLSGGINLQEIKKVERNFLPYSFMSNEKTSLEGCKPWHFYINADRLACLQADWYLVHLCTRRATRELVGNEYKDRHLQLLKGIENPENKFEEISKQILDLSEEDQKNFPIKLGYTSLCAALKINEKNEAYTSIFTHESFGSGEAYWIQCLQQAEVQKNQAVKISITSHQENLKTSKKGFNYLASWKFTQWESVELTEEMRGGIERAWEHQAEQINYWLNH